MAQDGQVNDERPDPYQVRPAEIPHGLRVAAAWSWRLLLIGFVIYLLGKGFNRFQVVVVPVLVSLLLSALTRPIYRAMARTPDRRGLPKSVAALLTILLVLIIVAGLIALIGQQVATGFSSLRDDAAQGLSELQRQLADSPLKLTSDQLNTYVQHIENNLRGGSNLLSGAMQVTSTAERVFTGLFLVLFTTYFFLSGGDKIWDWMVSLFPHAVQPKVRGAGTRAWSTLTAYIRATLIVAFVDGLGVGVGAAILGVPLAFPLGVLVFLGAFVPVVGALVSGSVAVLVALVAGGTLKALIMLAIVVAVQQIEAHGLQPFLLGRAVRVHPLGVILAIAVGVLLAGIVGALFAVPFVAVVNVVVGYLNSGEDGETKPEEETVGPLADETQKSDESDEPRETEAGESEGLDGTGHSGTQKPSKGVVR
jgi:predicted PurR-regulated permease PerM